MTSDYQPDAAQLHGLGFARYAAPAGQARYSRPSACGHETVVLYDDGALMLLETVNGQLLHCFQGRVASVGEWRVLLRQVNWPAEAG